MNARAQTQPILDAMKRATSLPSRARLVSDHEAEALARKVAAQREWLRERTFWKALEPRDDGLSMFLRPQWR